MQMHANLFWRYYCTEDEEYTVSGVFRIIKKLNLETNITDLLSLQSQSLYFQKKDTVSQELSFLSPVKHVQALLVKCRCVHVDRSHSLYVTPSTCLDELCLRSRADLQCDVSTLQGWRRENFNPRISLVIVIQFHIEDIRIQHLKSGLLSSLWQNSISSKKFETLAINHLDCREELDVELFTEGTCNRQKVRLCDSKDHMLQSWAWRCQRYRLFQQMLAWPWL